MNATHDIGVIHGRFQVLHNDHLAYILAGKSRCLRLVVGITNPDPTAVLDTVADPDRSDPHANPLTYYERYLMVCETLAGAGISRADFDVVPFPINLPELWSQYLPMHGVFFLTIYDGWGEEKLRMFRQAGLDTEVLWRRGPGEKGITGTDVRGRMARREPWRHLVPPEVARLVDEHGIAARIREMAGVAADSVP
ncbi:MAG: nicotinate-nucleotide adenylyltransferase [Desulfatibacillaceae bacterium]